jgi:hypothetical protein
LLSTVLASVAIGLGTLALAGSWLAWYASRAARVRAFEGRVEENMQNAARRIEACEARMVEWRAAMDGTLDQVEAAQERTTKERKRVEMANKRAEMLSGESDGGLPPPGASRSDQLDYVRRAFSRGA